MWQRFTERARRIILIAQEEAAKMSAGHVGTEHLLLGLVREDEGVAGQILLKMGVTQEEVRARIKALGESADVRASHKRDWLGREHSPEPKLTPEAKRVLELSADEARRMRHNYIGTEHLLLGVLRETDGMGSKMLRDLGVGLEDARARVLGYLGAEVPRSPEPPAAEAWEQPSDKTIVRVLEPLLQGDNMALKLLVASGLDAEAARERVRKFLQSGE